MAIRSLEHVWVNCNFKETQLEPIRIGQPVNLRVDAYPGKVFRGRVSGFSPGTGAATALLPPQNATGNFVKIVQRLPVRVDVIGGNSPDTPLFAGMSVEPRICHPRGARGTARRPAAPGELPGRIRPAVAGVARVGTVEIRELRPLRLAWRARGPPLRPSGAFSPAGRRGWWTPSPRGKARRRGKRSRLSPRPRGRGGVGAPPVRNAFVKRSSLASPGRSKGRHGRSRGPRTPAAIGLRLPRSRWPSRPPRRWRSSRRTSRGSEGPVAGSPDPSMP